MPSGGVVTAGGGVQRWAGACEESPSSPHQSVASRTHQTGDQTHNPGTCPDWESNLPPFGVQDNGQPAEPHQPGQHASVLYPQQPQDVTGQVPFLPRTLLGTGTQGPPGGEPEFSLAQCSSCHVTSAPEPYRAWVFRRVITPPASERLVCFRLTSLFIQN